MATQELILTSPEPKALTPMDLLSVALSKDAAIDVIERLAKLQQDEREYRAKVSFDDALNRCQERMRQVSADATNRQTSSRYATYAKIDSAIRPIYTAEGFAVSFGEKDCPTAGKTRFVAYLSRSGVTREYLKDLSPSTKGPKGNDLMTPIHADASADSYAKRYLVKNIFNIAIGEDDSDGNGANLPMPDDKLVEFLDGIKNANNVNELKGIYMAASKAAGNNQEYQQRFAREKNTRYRQIVTQDGGR